MDIATYFDVVTKPVPTLTNDKKNASTREAMKTYALIGMIEGLGIGVLVFVLGGLLGGFLALAGGGAGLGALVGGLGLVGLIFFPVLFGGLSVLFSYIWTGILWLIATRLLGGKGTFAENYYLTSRTVWPVFIVTVIVMILGTLIPFVGLVLPFIWSLYSVYISIAVLSVANGFSKLKGLITLLIPGIIIGIIAIGVAFSALAVLINPQTISANGQLSGPLSNGSTTIDTCSNKIGPFLVSQYSITADKSTLILVNQSGVDATINSVTIAGISPSNGNPTEVTIALNKSAKNNAVAPTIINHPFTFPGEEYDMEYTINYSAGELEDLTATGNCKGKF